LELVIIIAIPGLAMAYAVPGLRTMVTNNRISGNANDFIAAQQFSKAESASRINPVTMCKKNAAGNACAALGHVHYQLKTPYRESLPHGRGPAYKRSDCFGCSECSAWPTKCFGHWVGTVLLTSSSSHWALWNGLALVPKPGTGSDPIPWRVRRGVGPFKQQAPGAGVAVETKQEHPSPDKQR
jgi:hypothetical protein